MKILVVSIVDIEKSAPQRPHHFIRYLAKTHDVTIICVNDNWKNVDSAKYHLNENAYFEGIKLIYFTEKIIGPIYQELFIRFLLEKKELGSYEVIYNYNTLVSGKYIAKLLKIPMVYDIADDLPEMLAASPQIPKPLRSLAKFAGIHLVKRNIKKSARVEATSEVFKDIFSIETDKFSLIPNGVNTTLFCPMDASSELISRFSIKKHDFVLGYIGVLREWVDLTPIYTALTEISCLKLLVVGEEGGLDANKSLVREMGLSDRIIFAGAVPYEKIPQYLSVCDACLIPFRKNMISQNAIPLKLFEYMACDKPVISSHLDGVKSIAGDNIYYADTSREYEEVIKYLIKNTENMKPMREFVIANYDWNSLSKRLEHILESVK